MHVFRLGQLEKLTMKRGLVCLGKSKALVINHRERRMENATHHKL